MMKQICVLVLAGCIFTSRLLAQVPAERFTRRDTLFGSNTPQRSWWDVQHYDVTVAPDFETKTVSGKVTITYTITADRHAEYLQLDLQQPMQIDSLFYGSGTLASQLTKAYYN